MRYPAAVFALGVALAAPAFAQAPDAALFKCEFKDGTSWTYDDGKYASKPPAPLAFEIQSIDVERQTAALKQPGAERTTPLTIVRAINANHFLEAVNEGFLNLTTVYDKDPATGQHPAVHSRHFGLLGAPVFAQYMGFCSE